MMPKLRLAVVNLYTMTVNLYTIMLKLDISSFIDLPLFHQQERQG